MRVVITGAGLVGSSLAALMSELGQNIIVVDRDATALERIEEKLDVQTLKGHGGSERVLTEARVQEADLLIAVTDSDEVNVISAMTAKRLGVGTTVARIRSLEYLPGVRALYRDLLGIDFAVSPEALAALKLVDIVRTPGAGWVESFAGGHIRLMRMSLDSSNPLLGIKLKNFTIPQDYLLVGISRRNQLIIPSGEDELEALDDIYVVVNAANMRTVQELMSSKAEPAKSVMIGWGSAIGELVATLLERDVRVRMIEPDMERCELLASRLERAEIIHGDPMEAQLMQRENVGRFDVFMALGPRDDSNIMSCLLARDLGVRHTAAVVANPDFSDLVGRLGVDVAVEPRTLVANMISRFLRRREVVSIANIEGGKGQAIEFVVTSGSRVAGRPLRKVRFPEGSVVGAVMRGEQFVIPRGDDVLEAGDHALVFCLPDVSPAVEKMFAAR